MWVASEIFTSRTGVDWHAHVGGGLAGFGLGSVLKILRLGSQTKAEIAHVLWLTLLWALLALVPILLTRPLRATVLQGAWQRLRSWSRTLGRRTSKRATRALKARPVTSCSLLLVGVAACAAYALLPAAAESTCAQAGYTSVLYDTVPTHGAHSDARCRLWGFLLST